MDESTTDSGGSNWSEWLQGLTAGVVDKYATSRWVQPYETERLRLQALGELGYYPEGQRVPVQQQGIGINTSTLLLIGGALVVVMMLSKR